jgi:hypothetical protein
MTQATEASRPLNTLPRIVVYDLCAPAILERVLHEAEPYLERTAKYIANDFPAARADLVQEARITLWQLDLSRFPQRDVGYLKRILCTRMYRVYHSECLGGLTTGWSRHRGRGKRGGGSGLRKAA